MSDRTAALARAAAFAALRQSETAASPASHGATPDEAISALEAGLVASGAIEGEAVQPDYEAIGREAGWRPVGAVAADGIRFYLSYDFAPHETAKTWRELCEAEGLVPAPVQPAPVAMVAR